MKSVDQKLADIRGVLELRPGLFHCQGTVVATWRTVGERRLGPYYSLRYREGGRQRSVYLGRSDELAAKVRHMLRRLQEPRRRQLQLQRVRSAVRASLRRHKRVWREQLYRRMGLFLKGFEVRGWGQMHQPTETPAPPSGGVGLLALRADSVPVGAQRTIEPGCPMRCMALAGTYQYCIAACLSDLAVWR